MSEQALFREAQKLYQNKQYAKAVRTIVQIMETGEYSKQVLLLSAKAWIGLTVTDTDDQTWLNVYNTVDALMDKVESREEYQKLCCEIAEAREDATRGRLQELLRALERKPDFDQFRKYNEGSLSHFLFSAKITSSMSNHPKIKALLREDAEEGNIAVGNKFTEEEENLCKYNAGVRIFDKAKVAFETKGRSPLQTAEALLISRLLWKDAAEKMKKEPKESYIQRLEKNQSMIRYMLQLCRDYQVLKPSGQREWENDLSATTRELNKTKKALEQKKKQEEDARIAAYWAARPEMKAKLEMQLQEKEASYRKLSQTVKIAEKECDRLKQVLDQKLSIEKEYEHQKVVVKDLETQLGKCWFFQGKKKREINTRLSEEEYPKLTQLKEESQKERKELKEKTNSKIAELTATLSTQTNELAEIKKEVDSLRTELTMPR